MYTVGEAVYMNDPRCTHHGARGTVLQVDAEKRDGYIYYVDFGALVCWFKPEHLRPEDSEKAVPVVEDEYCGAMGIGGVGVYADNEMPTVPSIAAIERVSRMEREATYCRRCGQSDAFDGAMFTTGGCDICDDCF